MEIINIKTENLPFYLPNHDGFVVGAKRSKQERNEAPLRGHPTWKLNRLLREKNYFCFIHLFIV